MMSGKTVQQVFEDIRRQERAARLIEQRTGRVEVCLGTCPSCWEFRPLYRGCGEPKCWECQVVVEEVA